MIRSHSAIAGAVAGILGLALAGCSSGSTSSASTGGAGSLPAEIVISDIASLTGLAAAPSKSADTGTQLALKEVNDSGFLGASKIVLEQKDSASTAQNAAALLTEAAANSKYSAVLGPVDSPSAQAMSPIAQASSIPIVYALAGSGGVVIGDYTFRASPPAPSYFSITTDYLKQKGVKRIGVVYSTGISTTAELATKALPSAADAAGIKISTSTGVANDVIDFTTVATKIAQDKPDAVAVFVQTTQVSPAVTALRQAGYTGILTGYSGTNKETLKAAGADAKGFLHAASFDASMSSDGVKTFVDAYKAAYNTAPNYYAAEGYNRLWWLARAIKEAGSADRAAIQKGLAAVAKEGFVGANEVTFEGNDARTKGVLLQWDGTNEVVVN